MRKKGSFLRIASAILGSAIFLSVLYLLNEEKILQASLLGVIGVLLLTIAVFPFIKMKIKRKY